MVINNTYDPLIPHHYSPISPESGLLVDEGCLFSTLNCLEVVSRVSTGDCLLHVIKSIKNKRDMKVILLYLLKGFVTHPDSWNPDDSASTLYMVVMESLKYKLEMEAEKMRSFGGEEGMEIYALKLTEDKLDEVFLQETRNSQDKMSKREDRLEIMRKTVERYKKVRKIIDYVESELSQDENT